MIVYIFCVYKRAIKKLLQNTQLDLQDLMVDENILKLEIKRLRDILNEKADTVLSLEKRKLQLETAMKERRHEVIFCNNILMCYQSNYFLRLFRDSNYSSIYIMYICLLALSGHNSQRHVKSAGESSRRREAANII